MGVHVHSVHRGLTSIAKGVVRVERLSVFLPAMRHSICCCSLLELLLKGKIFLNRVHGL